ncbi:MAG: methyltransferase [Chthonomonadaceae bacterium]|uniref:SAM-dependent methyltransferase n=1 Tax=Candidatus Nitrosymbiomonas proteolyticus TaxID=2608984 RepID=A0A809S3F6_9BACT|nr:SAM-dependent methyltransferase [Candidatus Nitrosymbiomonas proteolyticus]
MEGPRGQLYDLAALFDDDYAYFHSALFTNDISDAHAAMLWDLLAIDYGMSVLDVGCGEGRLSNRLAEAGCVVTGIDLSPTLVDLACRDASERGFEVRYILGDVRDLAWEGEFDRAFLWFNTFGHFEEECNKEILAKCFRLLKPGGILLLDLTNRARHIAESKRAYEFAIGEDFLRDEFVSEWDDPVQVVVRTLVRGGSRRSLTFRYRMFEPDEIMEAMRTAGFAEVSVRDVDGGPFGPDSKRMEVLGFKSPE